MDRSKWLELCRTPYRPSERELAPLLSKLSESRLNDAIIDAYGKVIEIRSASRSSNGSLSVLLDVHMFSTHFYTRYTTTTRAHFSVSSRTKHVDVFSKGSGADSHTYPLQRHNRREPRALGLCSDRHAADEG